MLSLEPQRTDYDLHFQCLGFPVRVHPFFWLAAMFLGLNGAWDEQGNVVPEAGLHLLIWVSVMFASILIHELGHAIAMRYYGQSPQIVLYMLGGLAMANSASSFSLGQPARRSRYSHILISLAGPGAGFLLAGLTVALIFALGGQFRIDPTDVPFFYRYGLPLETGRPLSILIGDLLFLNIFWGLMNLLPVFPLDGGQVARELFQLSDPSGGLIRALWLSIITAVVIAFGSFAYLDSHLMPLLFLSLAASNYMTLQQLRGGGGFGGRPW